jgi:hypothetical protein
MDNIIEEVLKELPKKKKLCIMCEEKEAQFSIKGIPKDCYCRQCAIESFGDVDVLEKI